MTSATRHPCPCPPLLRHHLPLFLLDLPPIKVHQTRQKSRAASSIFPHPPDLPPLIELHIHVVRGSLRGLVAGQLNVSLSPPLRGSANFGRLPTCSRRWAYGHRVPCFSDPLLQKWKIAGNVYLSLSIQEITCKETKRPASADTIIPAPSNTSWFRPRREGPYSTSEPLCFLPYKAKRRGGDGRQVITGWMGNSGEKEIKAFVLFVRSDDGQMTH